MAVFAALLFLPGALGGWLLSSCWAVTARGTPVASARPAAPLPAEVSWSPGDIRDFFVEIGTQLTYLRPEDLEVLPPGPLKEQLERALGPGPDATPQAAARQILTGVLSIPELREEVFLTLESAGHARREAGFEAESLSRFSDALDFAHDALSYRASPAALALKGILELHFPEKDRSEIMEQIRGQLGRIFDGGGRNGSPEAAAGEGGGLGKARAVPPRDWQIGDLVHHRERGKGSVYGKPMSDDGLMLVIKFGTSPEVLNLKEAAQMTYLGPPGSVPKKKMDADPAGKAKRTESSNGATGESRKERAVPPRDWKIGDFVRHPEHGEGSVASTPKFGDGRKIVVNFEGSTRILTLKDAAEMTYLGPAGSAKPAEAGPSVGGGRAPGPVPRQRGGDKRKKAKKKERSRPARRGPAGEEDGEAAETPSREGLAVPAPIGVAEPVNGAPAGSRETEVPAPAQGRDLVSEKTIHHAEESAPDAAQEYWTKRFLRLAGEGAFDIMTSVYFSVTAAFDSIPEKERALAGALDAFEAWLSKRAGNPGTWDEFWAHHTSGGAAEAKSAAAPIDRKETIRRKWTDLGGEAPTYDRIFEGIGIQSNHEKIAYLGNVVENMGRWRAIEKGTVEAPTTGKRRRTKETGAEEGRHGAERGAYRRGEYPEALKRLIEIVSLDPFAFALRVADRDLPDVSGFWGTTNGQGRIDFNPYKRSSFALSILGKSEAGWEVRAENPVYRNGLYEFTILLKKGGETRRRVFQINGRPRTLIQQHLVEGQKRPTRPALDVSDQLGQQSIMDIALFPERFDERMASSDFPNLNGLLLGITDGSGRIYAGRDNKVLLLPAFVTRAESPDQAGWLIRIERYEVHDGILELALSKSKVHPETGPHEPLYGRLQMSGRYRTKARREGQDGPETLMLGNRLPLRDLAEVVRPEAFANKSSALSDLRGYLLGVTVNGVIGFNPIPYFSHELDLFAPVGGRPMGRRKTQGPDENGWLVRVEASLVRGGVIGLTLRLSKEDPATGVEQVLPLQYYEIKEGVMTSIPGSGVMSGQTEEVLDIVRVGRFAA